MNAPERTLSQRYGDAVIDYERRGSKEDKELFDELSAEIDNWAEVNRAASKLWRDAMEREAHLEEKVRNQDAFIAQLHELNPYARAQELEKVLREMLSCIEDKNIHLSGEWINTVCSECREIAHGALERKGEK